MSKAGERPSTITVHPGQAASSSLTFLTKQIAVGEAQWEWVEEKMAGEKVEKRL